MNWGQLVKFDMRLGKIDDRESLIDPEEEGGYIYRRGGGVKGI